MKRYFEPLMRVAHVRAADELNKLLIVFWIWFLIQRRKNEKCLRKNDPDLDQFSHLENYFQMKCVYSVSLQETNIRWVADVCTLLILAPFFLVYLCSSSLNYTEFI